MSSNLTVFHGGGFSNPWNGYLMTPAFNTAMKTIVQGAFIFDLRVMNKAITVEGGKAADSTDLGTVSYSFDDLLNNNGKVTLPFG